MADAQQLQILLQQRAAALSREVALLATLQPTPGPLGLGTLTPYIGGGMGKSGAARVPVGGPMRRGAQQPIDRHRPYPQLPVSRTASTLSTSSHVSLPKEDTLQEPEPLSPLNSPALASCVSLLATPELIGMFGPSGRASTPPPLLSLADKAHPETGVPAEPPCPSPIASTSRAGRASPTPEHKPHRHATFALHDRKPGGLSAMNDGPASSTILGQLSGEALVL